MSKDINYITAKIEKCKKLIENDPTNIEYQKYLEYWAVQGKDIKIKKTCSICKRTLLEVNYDEHYANCQAKEAEAERKKQELEAKRIAESKRLYEIKMAKEAKAAEKAAIIKRLAELETNETE